MEELEESVWSVVRLENEREDQAEGVQNSGKTGTETWALKKAQEKKLEVAEMRMLRWMCGVTKLDNNIKKWKNKRDNESGVNHKESTGKEVEVVWACGEKRGTLRRKEGDGIEIRGEKEERKT